MTSAAKTKTTIKKKVYLSKNKKLLLKLIDPKFIPNETLALLVRVPHVRD